MSIAVTSTYVKKNPNASLFSTCNSYSTDQARSGRSGRPGVPQSLPVIRRNFGDDAKIYYGRMHMHPIMARTMEDHNQRQRIPLFSFAVSIIMGVILIPGITMS